MWKQEIVLEDQANRPSLGGHPDPFRRIFEDDAIQADAPAAQREETGKRTQQRRFPCPVGAQHRDQFSGRNRQLHVELKGTQAGLDSCVECHEPPNQRSRKPMSTASETASKTRLRTMAASGLLSNAR